MNKKIRTAVAGAAIAIASIGGVAFTTGRAFAVALPGTPGTANCVGKDMSYFAQVQSGSGITGIGNLANFNNLSVKEIKAQAEAACA